MQVEDVRENEHDRNVSGNSLPGVSAISRKSVLLKIRFAVSRNPDTYDGMEDDGQKDEGPLDDRQKWQAVNDENFVLKNRSSPNQSRVGQQVDAHVGSNRHQAAQRMQSSDKEIVTKQKGLDRGRGCWRTHTKISWSIGE